MARPKRYKGKFNPSSQDVTRVMRRIGFKSTDKKARQATRNMMKKDPKFGRR